MSASSNHLESALGTYLLRTSYPSKPTELWVSLYLFYSLPGEDNVDGYEVATTSFGLPTGYGRVQYGPGDAYWVESSVTPGQFYNVAPITFGAPLYGWGTITGFALYDSVTGGSVWMKGFLSQQVTISMGDPPLTFAPGAFVINFL